MDGVAGVGGAGGVVGSSNKDLCSPRGDAAAAALSAVTVGGGSEGHSDKQRKKLEKEEKLRQKELAKQVTELHKKCELQSFLFESVSTLVFKVHMKPSSSQSSLLCFSFPEEVANL